MLVCGIYYTQIYKGIETGQVVFKIFSGDSLVMLFFLQVDVFTIDSDSNNGIVSALIQFYMFGLEILIYIVSIYAPVYTVCRFVRVYVWCVHISCTLYMVYYIALLPLSNDDIHLLFIDAAHDRIKKAIRSSLILAYYTRIFGAII